MPGPYTYRQPNGWTDQVTGDKSFDVEVAFCQTHLEIALGTMQRQIMVPIKSLDLVFAAR